MALPLRDLKKPQKYVLLADRLRRAIEEGSLRPGDRLPSLTELRRVDGSSQFTVERAHAILEQEGLIVREPNRGIFVAARQAPAKRCVIGIATRADYIAHPYYVRILQGIQRVAHQERQELLLLHQDSDVQWEKVDGMIVPGTSIEFMKRFPPGMPTVALLRSLREGMSVVADDRQATCILVEHLLALGHRRIAFFTDALMPRDDAAWYLSSAGGRQRLQGYRSALGAAGITAPETWVRNLRDYQEPMVGFEELGRQGMRKWLREDWDDLGCTAVLAQNDETAIGMIEALQEAGIRVPEDVSVAGFDGLEMADYFRPRLTTMRVPLEEIGATATRLLLDHLKLPLEGVVASPLPETSVIELSASLKIGQSTAPPRR